MVRSARRIAESEIYHVVSRGCGKQLIFEDDDDRKVFLEYLESELNEQSVELLAWCLMGNHFHLLLRAPMESISRLLRVLNSKYAMYYNKRHDRVGHLMQGRFKSEPVETDAYLMTVVRYIHLNPQKAGIGSLEQYPWSSYREYLEAPRLIAKDFVLGVFGGEKEFVAFHKDSDAGAACIDIDRGRKIIDDESALDTARQVLAPMSPEAVARLDREERDSALCSLKEANLSLRQIERLTGISKSVVAAAKRVDGTTGT